MAEPLYRCDGGVYLPSPLTVGPWSSDAQHGGPVTALLARAVETAPGPDGGGTDMQVVRLTVELLRPVPVAPLSIEAEVVRPGRNVQLVEAALRTGDGKEVARARALRIRRLAVDVPVELRAPPAPPPPAGSEPPSASQRTAFAEAVDLRFVSGGWDELGPVTVWSRLTVPLVDDEVPSPLQRSAAAADFGNGISRVVDFTTHVFINPDITVSLARVPEGEWIGLDVVTRLSAEGYGHAESQIFDAAGPVGRAVQSLIVTPR